MKNIPRSTPMIIPIIINDTIYTRYNQCMSMSEKNTWPKQKTLEAQSSAITLEERVWASWTRFQVNRNMVKSNNYLNKMRIKWIADIMSFFYRAEIISHYWHRQQKLAANFCCWTTLLNDLMYRPTISRFEPCGTVAQDYNSALPDAIQEKTKHRALMKIHQCKHSWTSSVWKILQNLRFKIPELWFTVSEHPDAAESND